ncbi:MULTISPECIES: PEP-CTERM sorting domain-containing protein [unclassified Massilia]
MLTITPAPPVPEPGAWMMLGGGLLVLAAFFRRSRGGGNPY